MSVSELDQELTIVMFSITSGWVLDPSEQGWYFPLGPYEAYFFTIFGACNQ